MVAMLGLLYTVDLFTNDNDREHGLWFQEGPIHKERQKRVSLNLGLEMKRVRWEKIKHTQQNFCNNSLIIARQLRKVAQTCWE